MNLTRKKGEKKWITENIPKDWSEM
jgi:hypothetical protein